MHDIIARDVFGRIECVLYMKSRKRIGGGLEMNYNSIVYAKY